MSQKNRVAKAQDEKEPQASQEVIGQVTEPPVHGAVAAGLRHAAKAAPILVPFKHTTLSTWFERDRAHVALTHKLTDKTLIQWWDEDVESAVEDGYLDPKDYHGSAYAQAEEHGMLDAAEVYKGWGVTVTAARKDVLDRYDSSDLALREVGVKDFVTALQKDLAEAYPGAKIEVKLVDGRRHAGHAIETPHGTWWNDADFSKDVQDHYDEMLENPGDWCDRSMKMGCPMTPEAAAKLAEDLGIHPNLGQAIRVCNDRIMAIDERIHQIRLGYAELDSMDTVGLARIKADLERVYAQQEMVQQFSDALVRCQNVRPLDDVDVYDAGSFRTVGEGKVLVRLASLGDYAVDANGLVARAWLTTKNEVSEELRYVALGNSGKRTSYGTRTNECPTGSVEDVLPVSAREGRFVNMIHLQDGGLLLYATPEFQDEVASFLAKSNKYGSDVAMGEVLEDWLGNGWNIVGSASDGGGDFTITDQTSLMLNKAFTYYDTDWRHQDALTENPVKALATQGHIYLVKQDTKDWLDSETIAKWKAETEADRVAREALDLKK